MKKKQTEHDVFLVCSRKTIQEHQQCVLSFHLKIDSNIFCFVLSYWEDLLSIYFSESLYIILHKGYYNGNGNNLSDEKRKG